MKSEQHKAQKLTFIFLFFFALLNYPILNLFNKSELVGGFPLLYIYIFMLWILLIIVTALTIRSS